jgi:hypothetical protein
LVYKMNPWDWWGICIRQRRPMTLHIFRGSR